MSFPSTLGEKFECIVIDGQCRGECAREIKDLLNWESEEGAMVILDNADWNPQTTQYLREELDLIEVDFAGFGPINGYTWTTSIFLTRNFAFKPKDSQPNYSLAALHYKVD